MTLRRPGPGSGVHEPPDVTCGGAGGLGAVVLGAVVLGAVLRFGAVLFVGTATRCTAAVFFGTVLVRCDVELVEVALRAVEAVFVDACPAAVEAARAGDENGVVVGAPTLCAANR